MRRCTCRRPRPVSTRGVFTDRKPMRSEGFYPVVLATALLCIGWAIVVEPELYHNFNLLGQLPFSGQPELPYQALQFGFIGAYWFILQDLTRRYFRQDLKTAAYVASYGSSSEPLGLWTLLSRHKRRRLVDRITDRFHVFR